MAKTRRYESIHHTMAGPSSSAATKTPATSDTYTMKGSVFPPRRLAYLFMMLMLLSISDPAEAFHSIVPPSTNNNMKIPATLSTKTLAVSVTPLALSQRSVACTKGQLFSSSSEHDMDDEGEPSLWEKLIASMSQSAARKLAKKYNRDIAPVAQSKFTMSVLTFARVIIPSVIAGIVAYLIFPALAMFLCTTLNDAGVFAVLSQDSSQFVQNFLTVSGLLFSILVGQTYYFMYQQQETVYYALFNEVTEAKSLLEQVALVSQGRSMYQRVLQAMSTYVQTDLKKLQADPAVLLSARPMDDPLETIMYLTSVGVPSTVYETIKSLRQARAQRLGALQRKLPTVHMVLLWILALLELVSFPLLGAGTQVIGGYKILTVEGCLFGVMTMGIVLTLRVVGELWRPAGGAYNVDNVLKVMVRGLEQELEARMAGKTINAQRGNFPSPNVV